MQLAFKFLAAKFGGRGSTVGGVDQSAACASLPSNLQAGCYWRYNWAGGDLIGWNIYYEDVDCPDRLTSISGCSPK
jgi:Glycosyl hydrolase family 45